MNRRRSDADDAVMGLSTLLFCVKDFQNKKFIFFYAESYVIVVEFHAVNSFRVILVGGTWVQ